MATTAEIEAAIRAADKDPDQARGDADIARLSKELERIKKTELFPPGPLRTFDDLTAASMDAVTRGFGTKLFGGEAQDRAQDQIDRQGAAAIPAQVAGTVVASPYRVGGMGVGALAGGLEGALSAYGHQKDWVPGWNEALDIGKGAVAGSGLGAAGAKLGEWAGKGWSAVTGGHVPNPQAGDPNLLRKVGEKVEPLSLFGKKSYKHIPAIAATEWGLSHFGIPPGATTGVATTLNTLGKTRWGQQSATLANPAVVEPMRDAFAKMMIGVGRSQ
jgi:hypothetical protein